MIASFAVQEKLLLMLLLALLALLLLVGYSVSSW